MVLDRVLHPELASRLPEHTSNCTEGNVSGSLQLVLVRMLTLGCCQWE
jgi:hypothetical protein